jgi:hypothetical protein
MNQDGQLYCDGCGAHFGPHTLRAGAPKRYCPKCREVWRSLYMKNYRKDPKKRRKITAHQRRWRRKRREKMEANEKQKKEETLPVYPSPTTMEEAPPTEDSEAKAEPTRADGVRDEGGQDNDKS